MKPLAQHRDHVDVASLVWHFCIQSALDMLLLLLLALYLALVTTVNNPWRSCISSICTRRSWSKSWHSRGEKYSSAQHSILHDFSHMKKSSVRNLLGIASRKAPPLAQYCLLNDQHARVREHGLVLTLTLNNNWILSLSWLHLIG